MDIRLAEHTVREQMLAGVLRFVRAVERVSGVRRIALLGSIVTLSRIRRMLISLVTVTGDADLAPLALCARRLQGRLQGLNHWADVFLADERGQYLGRTCSWRQCRPGVRASCDALHCGRRPHLHDDLADVRLTPHIIADPPLELWPAVVRRGSLPRDVEHLLAALEHAV